MFGFNGRFMPIVEQVPMDEIYGRHEDESDQAADQGYREKLRRHNLAAIVLHQITQARVGGSRSGQKVARYGADGRQGAPGDSPWAASGICQVLCGRGTDGAL